MSFARPHCRQLLLVIAAGLFIVSAAAQVYARSWKAAGKLVYPEGEAYLLNAGHVFAPAVDYLHPGSQTWDPTTNSWKGLPSMQSTRYSPATVVLKDGRVLVTGGLSGSTILNSAEIYDPTTNIWSLSSGTMQIARYQHRATRLRDGRVLVAGGCSSYGCGTGARMAEIYDPATDSFSTTGSLQWNTTAFTSTLLKNGGVLITGESTTAEIYHPSTGRWLAAGNMSTNRIFHTATLLPNGKVLVAGGSDNFGVLLNTTEVFDPAKRTWSPAGPMSAVRESHGAILLPKGNVLIAGGMSIIKDAYVVLNTAEVFNPATGQFTSIVPMKHARVDFGLLLLQDGRAMAVGGDYYVVGRKFYPGDAESF